jgi:hypothetical protein
MGCFLQNVNRDTFWRMERLFKGGAAGAPRTDGAYSEM